MLDKFLLFEGKVCAYTPGNQPRKKLGSDENQIGEVMNEGGGSLVLSPLKGM